jgi:hypothetical protein
LPHNVLKYPKPSIGQHIFTKVRRGAFSKIIAVQTRNEIAKLVRVQLGTLGPEFALIINTSENEMTLASATAIPRGTAMALKACAITEIEEASQESSGLLPRGTEHTEINMIESDIVLSQHCRNWRANPKPRQARVLQGGRDMHVNTKAQAARREIH